MTDKALLIAAGAALAYFSYTITNYKLDSMALQKNNTMKKVKFSPEAEVDLSYQKSADKCYNNYKLFRSIELNKNNGVPLLQVVQEINTMDILPEHKLYTIELAKVIYLNKTGVSTVLFKQCLNNIGKVQI